ncbi:hypothetical protein M8A51_24175 [Schlegelella sp. S2-27]|uniref:Uncharacterized protein n=1 Tax=Caldimonas mangrovi TaxID=2944811 RepID=A0ABT0YV59_9BURK|nr:hypothetical protein [Caldimonas mangrovi]MCM5682641.1 hypothetical protein [Caldimonas mangrovi]
MTANELEVLLTAAMLLALPVIAMFYWRDNRAISWGALGLCLLIPEAASEHPNAALLHSIMAITAVIVVLQLGIDALKQRQQARDGEPTQPRPAPLPEETADARAVRDDAPVAWPGTYGGVPQPAAPGLQFLRRKHPSEHAASPAPGTPWRDARGNHEGQRP